MGILSEVQEEELTQLEKELIPRSRQEAGQRMREGFRLAHSMSMPFWANWHLLRMWYAICYLYPGLHPDGYDDAESGWPKKLYHFASEMWARYEQNKIEESQLYPANAVKASIAEMRKRNNLYDN